MYVNILLTIGFAATSPTPGPATPDCACATARVDNGWCAACKVGYVAGFRIPSHALFEALDAHGHDINPASIKCESCKKALETDGFCEKCRMGFLRGKAYVSRLNYHLAHGKIRNPADIKCGTCKANTAKYGWCDVCKVGMVGHVALADKRHYEPAAREAEILVRAIALAEKCELCAAAMVLDGKCPRCKIEYKDGQAAPKKSP